jgi:hypothetical protein
MWGAIAIIVVLLNIRAEGSDLLVGVASVIDGDTIEIHGRRKRPALRSPSGERWRCGSKQALRWPVGSDAAQLAAGVAITTAMVVSWPCSMET